ncbi:MFS transporter [Burkholderia vietnamiensis]|uniref:MFS transporter n=1 Tax=Burkholderia vietnamiensis TaxID=60552 RepID=UPI001D149EE5|nr:MFS transporter [Burkholderia vietnamiensis]UEC01663.1 MFS transporter [Burkholderia vietnamiensis]
MPTVPFSNAQKAGASPALTRSLMLLMAVSAGVGMANLYYNQPLLEQMRTAFGLTVQQAGWIPTLTQLGYALGMLFLVPLGDMLSRKPLVLSFTLTAALGSLGIAMSTNFMWLAVMSFLFGLSTMAPQLLVPFAAYLAPNEAKGRVVGTMVSGILVGVLLARTVSGFVGASFGWRAMFGLAAVVLCVNAVVLGKALPTVPPTYHGRYLGLLVSVWQFLKREPVLREACLFGAMQFGSFMVFWSSLIHLMETPTFGLGPRAVGLYGLLGAAAILLGPLVGSFADKTDPRRLTGAMIGLLMASYAVVYLGSESLVVIGLGVLLMDIGMRMGHVTNQGRIFRLAPHAQSRLQTAYMVSYFCGGALGSALGSWAWAQWRWAGVCLSAAIMLSIAALRWLMPPAPAT